MDIVQRLRDERVEGVAPWLLGAVLWVGESGCRIVEVEAYGGSDDMASHAYRGVTPRNATMFGPPGRAYVYLSYGNHWMLNVSAHREGEGAGVLIRAARPLVGMEAMFERRVKATREVDLLSGPGKLTQALGIDRSLDGANLFEGGAIRLEVAGVLRPYRVGRRIGIAKGRGDETLWRFVDAEEGEWASRPHLRGEPVVLD